jgi:hypothetical protein
LFAAYEPVMTDNHRSVIGEIMPLTNAEKQASWRERNLKNENGTRRAQFIFDASTRGAAQADRLSHGLLGDVSHQGGGGGC